MQNIKHLITTKQRNIYIKHLITTKQRNVKYKTFDHYKTKTKRKI